MAAHEPKSTSSGFLGNSCKALCRSRHYLMMNDLLTLFRRSPAETRSDGELLSAFIGTRDEDAFAELIRRHSPTVWGICRRELSDPTDAEDAFQATFLVLVQRATRLVASPTVGPWLFEVAVRTVANLRRKNSRRVARCVFNPDDIADPRSTCSVTADVDSILLGLSKRYRAALLLCYVEGLTHREAATRLGCSEGTVSSLVSRGLAKLRTKFAGRDPAVVLSLVAVSAPATVATAAVRAAVRLRLSSLTAAADPAVVALAREVLHMFWVRNTAAIGITAAFLLALGFGAGLSLRQDPQALAIDDSPAKKMEQLPSLKTTNLATTMLTSKVAAKQPSVVCYFPKKSEVVGIVGNTVLYRKSLRVSGNGYGVDGDKLVLVGDDFDTDGKQAVTVVDLSTGSIIGKKQLSYKMPPPLRGVTELILVNAKEGKCYFGAIDEANYLKKMLVRADLQDLGVEYYDIGLHVRKTIAIKDDLGFCTSDTVYRYSKPPLTQKDGFDGSGLPKPYFHYLNGSGLYNVDSSNGTVARVADDNLRPLPKQPAPYQLAGARLLPQMVTWDAERRLVISAAFTAEKKTDIQALDVAQGKIVWQKTASGAIDRILLSKSQSVYYMLDSEAKRLNRINLDSLDVTEYASFDDSFSSDAVLIWAR